MRGMMGQLEVAMRALTLSPGRFDSLVAPLVDAITPCLTNAAQAHAIISAILRQVSVQLFPNKLKIRIIKILTLLIPVHK